MAAEKDRLHESGKRLLESLRKDIQTGEALFEEYGRQFREADAEDQPGLPTGSSKKSLFSSFANSVKVPQWAVVVALVLVTLALLPRLWDWDDPVLTRGRSLDLEEVLPINRDLVQVLVRRGDFLLIAGNNEGKREYYEEARSDLLQAYELDPENPELLSLLARVHEKLGHHKKAQEFLKKWQTAKANQE